MPEPDATAKYLEFLLDQGAVSHIVSPQSGATLSTLALTQRCLASGVEFPVPLPDGSVAINLAGEVPKALAALDLTIEAYPSSQDAAGGDTPPEPEDAGMAPEDASPPVDFSAESDAQDEAQLPETQTMAEEPVGEILEEAPESDASEFASDVSTAEGFDASDMPSDDGMDSEETVHDQATDVTPAAGEEAEESAPPMFIAASRDQGAENSTASGSFGSVSETPDTSAPVMAPDEPDAATELAPEPSDDSEAFDDALPEADDTAEGSDVDDQARAESVERIARIEAMLTQLEGRFAAMETGQAGLAERVEAFSGELGEAVSRPLPRPDVNDFNRGMARIMTALSQSIRRIEEALENPAPQQTGDASSGVAASLSTGLTALADAVRAAHEEQGATSADLAIIASMQKTLSHQLAKLLESNHAQQAPVMEEFLMDIRHATAELLAEQARVAKAS
ncbi:MAG: hypothetical protein AAFY31_03845 [Pseudomonadota bacterium]